MKQVFKPDFKTIDELAFSGLDQSPDWFWFCIKYAYTDDAHRYSTLIYADSISSAIAIFEAVIDDAIIVVSADMLGSFPLSAIQIIRPPAHAAPPTKDQP